MRRFWPPAVILILFAVCGIVYSTVTPYRTAGILLSQRDAEGNPQQVADVGAPDERQHANYILRLQEGRGLPVLDPKDPELYENYQAHQPPLYYGIAAAVGRVVGSDLADPKGGLGLRLFSVLLGCLTICGIWSLVRWGSGRDLPAHCAALFGLMPMFVSLNSSISNDPLLFCLMTWSLAFLIKAVRDGFPWGPALAAGALAGLVILTKTTAVSMLPLFVAAGWPAWQSGRLKTGAWLGMIGLALAMAAPWWFRNLQVYGDPLAMNAFRASFTGSAQAAAFIEGFGAFGYWTQWVAWWTFRSLVGLFGYMDIPLFSGESSSTLYLAVLLPLGLVFAAGVLRRLVHEDQTGPIGEDETEEVPGFGLLLGVLLTVIILLFIQFNRTYFQGQARYLYPAVGPIAGFFGLGAAMIGRRAPWLTWGILLVGFVVLNMVAVSAIREGFPLRVLSG
ncbi:MAG: glycosyltransferase family 39 protein [Fimbriimonadaceae bacterium]|nr:glycosyltransferase family 39 protein [Fimbriimonadaceae bacterium]